MAVYLLDSDAVIDYLKGVSLSIGLIDGLSASGHEVAICGPVLVEVYSGLTEAEARLSDEFLDGLRLLATSRTSARLAGRWRYEYRRRGVALAVSDLLIAATAFEHDATLISANLRHYPMPELKLLPLPR